MVNLTRDERNTGKTEKHHHLNKQVKTNPEKKKM